MPGCLDGCVHGAARKRHSVSEETKCTKSERKYLDNSKEER